MDSCAVVEEEDCIEIKVQGNSTASRKTFQVSKVGNVLSKDPFT